MPELCPLASHRTGMAIVEKTLFGHDGKLGIISYDGLICPKKREELHKEHHSQTASRGRSAI